jgi:hypothetical protein
MMNLQRYLLDNLSGALRARQTFFGSITVNTSTLGRAKCGTGCEKRCSGGLIIIRPEEKAHVVRAWAQRAQKQILFENNTEYVIT